MSLRARLLVTMLVVVTAGLLAADVATYRFLSSFLLDRVDQQLVVLPPAAARELSPPPFGPADQHEWLDLFPATYVAAVDQSGQIVNEQLAPYGAQTRPELPPGAPRLD